MKRYGMTTRLKPGAYAKYKALHADPWPGVNDALKRANISNYSIYHRDGMMFSYFEYSGEDLAADFEKIGKEEAIQRWMAEVSPLFDPFEDAELWSPMEELYHLD